MPWRHERPHPSDEEHGGLVATPTLRRHTIYRHGGDAGYEVWHERTRTVGSFHAALEHVVETYERLEAEEDAVAEALASADELAACRLGWHRAEQGAWFTLANGGRRGHLIVYWVGSVPVECLCRSVMSLGGATFACAVCGTDVDADTPAAPPRTTLELPRRSREDGTDR